MTTIFFLWTAVAIGATVFAGFWFTYFGPMLSGERAPDAAAVHLHGWSFFAWYALLVAQAALVQSHRVALHRTLGGASVALAALMVATGLLVVGVRMDDAMKTGDPFWSTSGPAVFATLVLFASFYVAAIRMRRRTDWHKRLMIIASVGGMGAATFRVDRPLHLRRARGGCAAAHTDRPRAGARARARRGRSHVRVPVLSATASRAPAPARA